MWRPARSFVETLLIPLLLPLCFVVALVTAPGAIAAEAAGYSIRVDRSSKKLTVRRRNGEFITAPIGIGKGGLGTKKSMDDLITPSGKLSVDIVLADDLRLVRISDALRKRWQNDVVFGPYVRDSSGLVRLWRNMRSLDFNGDEKGDTAYGIAYIGLHSADGKAITGPGPRKFKGVPYWYSIALHGTPSPAKAIGRATSGGCVHVEETVLLDLLQNVTIGTPVEIF